jgi:hypothetical protein
MGNTTGALRAKSGFQSDFCNFGVERWALSVLFLRFFVETRSLPAFARSYPRRFTFYLAHPIHSILTFSFTAAFCLDFDGR